MIIFDIQSTTVPPTVVLCIFCLCDYDSKLEDWVECLAASKLPASSLATICVRCDLCVAV